MPELRRDPENTESRCNCDPDQHPCQLLQDSSSPGNSTHVNLLIYIRSCNSVELTENTHSPNFKSIQGSAEMSIASINHIWLDSRNVAWIDQSNIKVIEIALERMAHGSSVEEIVEQHGGLLSLAQVHAALSYYYDHEAELDAEIECQLTVTDQLRRKSLSSPGRLKLATKM
jgi:uncharacterized protein (DUF433 family)